MNLADSRRLPSREALPKAREAARKALELDENLGEAHVELARVAMNLDWNWAGAERELKRGIELNSNVGHIFYSLYSRRCAEKQARRFWLRLNARKRSIRSLPTSSGGPFSFTGLLATTIGQLKRQTHPARRAWSERPQPYLLRNRKLCEIDRTFKRTDRHLTYRFPSRRCCVHRPLGLRVCAWRSTQKSRANLPRAGAPRGY